MPNEILLIDKPVGFSSFQIVRLLKKQYEKVGHAGTLDPIASGLLIILIGKQTKNFLMMQTFDKEYIGEFVLGMSTDTYDISGGNFHTAQTLHIQCSLQRCNEVAQTFVGEMWQRPPRFSAIKHNGKRLYELSRAGITVIPQSRKVFIRSFSITEIRFPIVTFHAVVGKGVYIRSLINDFGNVIGGGSILLSLRRVRIGNYHVMHAKRLGTLLHRERV
jgi:tRNA pseudouridine55 synthase